MFLNSLKGSDCNLCLYSLVSTFEQREIQGEGQKKLHYRVTIAALNCLQPK